MTIIIDGADKPATRASLGLTIGTDVLAPNGSAASLTNIPAAQLSGTIGHMNLGTGGSASTFLRGDGTFAAIAAGGSLELIASLTANNSADLTFTGLTTHRAYLFIGTEIVPATNQTDAITLFDTSGTLRNPYDGFVFAANSAGSALTRTTKSGVSAMNIQSINPMAKKVPGVNTGYNYSFTLIRDTDSTGGNALFGNFSYHGTASGMHSGFFAYRSQPTYSLGSLKYAVASGNITSGRMTCYGYKES